MIFTSEDTSFSELTLFSCWSGGISSTRIGRSISWAAGGDFLILTWFLRGGCASHIRGVSDCNLRRWHKGLRNFWSWRWSDIFFIRDLSCRRRSCFSRLCSRWLSNTGTLRGLYLDYLTADLRSLNYSSLNEVLSCLHPCFHNLYGGCCFTWCSTTISFDGNRRLINWSLWLQINVFNSTFLALCHLFGLSLSNPFLFNLRYLKQYENDHITSLPKTK